MSEPSWIPLGGAPASPWMTGDTKISMQPASHDDPAGGRWLLADGSAIPAQYTGLIALAGANLPDARGRGIVAKGTHADVDAIGDSDGVVLASRSPKHKSSVNDPTHSHGISNWISAGAATNQPRGFNEFGQVGTSLTAAVGTGVTVGPAASAMIDTGSYIVVGNLFVHT